MARIQVRHVVFRPKIVASFALSSILCYAILFRSETYLAVPLWQSAGNLGDNTISNSSGNDINSKIDYGQVQEALGVDDPQLLVPEQEHESNPIPDDMASMEQFCGEYNSLKSEFDTHSIYGATIFRLGDKEERVPEQEAVLRMSSSDVAFSNERPHVFSPYPSYNSLEWSTTHAEYVPCTGPGNTEIRDIGVFKGHPVDYPAPSFGSYAIFGIDSNLCFERTTRLGLYGLTYQVDMHGRMLNWNKVPWGLLQSQCVEQNTARFASGNRSQAHSISIRDGQGGDVLLNGSQGQPKVAGHNLRSTESLTRQSGAMPDTGTFALREARTALLLRSYTGKQYTENDKQTIRSLITELCLRTGGEYQVFLLVQSKTNYDIWATGDTYDFVLQTEVPEEFWNITILWNDDIVNRMYPTLVNYGFDKTQVHNAQYLSVQKFSQEHPEFDYVWNWEMDARVTGHHYDTLTKIVDFARRQPRKGLWDRNERFYIPSFHGDYDTDFRRTVEVLSGNESIWGAPNLSFIKPVGPTPPVESPGKDDYRWGVGEEADLITLSPLFNPENSNWVLRDQVWGYSDEFHSSKNLPRRATVVTHSRISKRLLDAMHAENLRGNHLGSEMAAQTVALLHGLKAVYAPMPVFMDRPWSGDRLARWFNGGPKGVSGGIGSAMGWSREGRFRGATWYYRADPPQRLYNNWLGHEDTGTGGEIWEGEHGRPCLPAMILHPIKNFMPTEPGTSSESELPYH